MPSFKRPTVGILGGKPAFWPARTRILRWHAEGCDFGDGKKVVGKMVIDPGGFVTVKVVRRHKRFTLTLAEAISAIAIAAQRKECARVLGTGEPAERAERDLGADSGDGAQAERGGSEQGHGD